MNSGSNLSLHQEPQRVLCRSLISIARICGITATCLTSLPAWGDAGQVTMCNEGRVNIIYAAWREVGESIFFPDCELTQKKCSVDAGGWTLVKPGNCGTVEVGTAWSAYVSIYYRKADRWVLASYPLKPKWAQGREPGMSGTTNLSLCGKQDKFSRRASGTLDQAFNETCRAGMEKIPINGVVRSAPDTEFTITVN